MADELQADQATDQVESAVDSAATQDGGKSEIANQIKDALGGSDTSTQDNSPREQMRRQIGEALEKAVDPNTPEATEAAAKPTGERARGPDGRFIPTAQEAAAGIDPNVAQPDAQSVVNAAPGAWKKELQARWNELPPEFQAEISKREADVAKGFEKYQNLRANEPVLDFLNQVAPRLGTSGPQLLHQMAVVQDALLDPSRSSQAVDALIQAYGVDKPYAPVLTYANQIAQQTGTSPAELVTNWARVDQALRNPAQQRQAIEFIAKSYGIDLGQPAQANGEPWVDPDIAALKQQQDQIANWIRQQEQQATVQAQQYQQQLHQTKVSAVDQFASEKGPDGQPLYPHLETVIPDMAAGVARIKSANPQISDQEALKQAYEAAVWSNPQTRQLQLQATLAAQEKERLGKTRERAQAAARGAVSPATSSPQGPAAGMPLKGDIRDQMRQHLEQLT